ncbi:hypothetical protein HYPSUDRAFT_210204 [Hypholoma sublateritium FD-334 SS-4]|uniref:Uncharacterized protein n=1 Tax=Hypholoma sublateritium (strain FD-334 SS-4) TaxID=945553 RepID=A0A0D2N0L4_HYPSF|nr:hypothetical protein HYPSUDRAFT_210204 [Hypholoma sublateritium FD-334 SS-4]
MGGHAGGVLLGCGLRGAEAATGDGKGGRKRSGNRVYARRNETDLEACEGTRARGYRRAIPVSDATAVYASGKIWLDPYLGRAETTTGGRMRMVDEREGMDRAWDASCNVAPSGTRPPNIRPAEAG